MTWLFFRDGKYSTILTLVLLYVPCFMVTGTLYFMYDCINYSLQNIYNCQQCYLHSELVFVHHWCRTAGQWMDLAQILLIFICYHRPMQRVLFG